MIAMATGNVWGGRLAGRSAAPDKLCRRLIIAADCFGLPDSVTVAAEDGRAYLAALLGETVQAHRCTRCAGFYHRIISSTGMTAKHAIVDSAAPCAANCSSAP